MLISPRVSSASSMIFFFNDTATTEIYTLSLHDALPIYGDSSTGAGGQLAGQDAPSTGSSGTVVVDRKSTRLNSSHSQISYAVFCLKKKKKKKKNYKCNTKNKRTKKTK